MPLAYVYVICKRIPFFSKDGKKMQPNEYHFMYVFVKGWTQEPVLRWMTWEDSPKVKGNMACSILWFDLETDPNKQNPIVKRRNITRQEALQHVMAAYSPLNGWVWETENSYRYYEGGKPTAEVEIVQAS